MFGFFSSKKKAPEPKITQEDVKYFWTHQVLVLTRGRVKLKSPLFTIQNKDNPDRDYYITRLPYVVGDGGMLIPPRFVTILRNSVDPKETTLTVDYLLSPEDKRKVMLRFKGSDPQIVSVVTDQRKDDEGFLVLVIPKLMDRL